MFQIEEILNGRKLEGINYFFPLCKVVFEFSGKLIIRFSDCAVMYDSGLIGRTIFYVSTNGSLGPVLALREMSLDPDDYKVLFLCENVREIHDKHEIQILYKTMEISDDDGQSWQMP
jgi:hypothetical protein